MKNYVILLIGIAVTILANTFVLYTTSVLTEQTDGISEWSGTPEGMIGVNFDKCEKTEGSNIVYGDPPVCYLPNSASYQIDE